MISECLLKGYSSRSHASWPQTDRILQPYIIKDLQPFKGFKLVGGAQSPGGWLFKSSGLQGHMMEKRCHFPEPPPPPDHHHHHHHPSPSKPSFQQKDFQPNSDAVNLKSSSVCVITLFSFSDHSSDEKHKFVNCTKVHVEHFLKFYNRTRHLRNLYHKVKFFKSQCLSSIIWIHLFLFLSYIGHFHEAPVFPDMLWIPYRPNIRFAPYFQAQSDVGTFYEPQHPLVLTSPQIKFTHF